MGIKTWLHIVAMILLGTGVFANVAVAQVKSRAAVSEKAWLLKPDRVFDARSEQAHPGWVVLERNRGQSGL